MKILFLLLPLFIFAKSELVNCYEIFEQRKNELELKLEQIAEQQQVLQSLKDATMNILKKKEEKLKQKEADINKTLQQIEAIKKENEELVKKYQKILQDIKNTTASKLVKSYSKMRASNAANILANMDTNTSLEKFYLKFSQKWMLKKPPF